MAADDSDAPQQPQGDSARLLQMGGGSEARPSTTTCSTDVTAADSSTADDGRQHILTDAAPPTWRTLLPLTIVLAGLQLVWAVEMGYGTPYLSQLGLSKSMLTLAWLAGPLSGLIMQPLVGRWSDSCASRWGRRRPFIVGGTVGIVLSLSTVALAEELGAAIGTLATESQADTGHVITIVLAVAGFCSLDFAINAVQASCRSLIVDVLPLRHQQTGSTWASLMIGCGNIAGYLIGGINLTRLLPMSQLKGLICLAVILMITGAAITCYCVHESPLHLRHNDRNISHNSCWADVVASMRGLFSTLFYLPRGIQLICCAQFFAWFGWFSVNFFSSEWIRELVVLEHRGDGIDSDAVSPDAVRVGSLTLLLFSGVSLGGAVIVPYVTRLSGMRLTTVWAASHILFAALMLCAFFVNSAAAGMAVVTSVGLCWAVTMWIPFALLGECIHRTQLDVHAFDPLNSADSSGATPMSVSPNRLKRRRRKSGQKKSDMPPVDTINVLSDEDSAGCDRSSGCSDGEDGGGMDDDAETVGHFCLLTENDATGMMGERNGGSEGALTTGVVLGIHNAYIVMPQLLASLTGSIIFHHYGDGPHSIALVWQVGGVMALGAAAASLYCGEVRSRSTENASSTPLENATARQHCYPDWV